MNISDFLKIYKILINWFQTTNNIIIHAVLIIYWKICKNLKIVDS